MLRGTEELIDIGSDHGLLCAYAVTMGRAAHATAADISADSLSKARALIKELSLEDKVGFAVSDGFINIDIAVLPALNCYMLQMGVYSSHENAQKEAERLRALGAAGYIFADSSSGETRYRVMASGYDSEQSAKSVKDRLTSEGVEAAMYTLSSPQASFRVTADKSAK